MIDLIEFEKIARARLEDSHVLAIFNRYGGAIYLCGYALEIALKIKISKEHNQSSFPETRVEFRNFPIGGERIKTHNLSVLLSLSPSMEQYIRNSRECFRKFNRLSSNWNAEFRYKQLSILGDENLCFKLIEDTEDLLKIIL